MLVLWYSAKYWDHANRATHLLDVDNWYEIPANWVPLVVELQYVRNILVEYIRPRPVVEPVVIPVQRWVLMDFGPVKKPVVIPVQQPVASDFEPLVKPVMIPVQH